MSVIWVGTKHHGTSSGNQSAATTQKRPNQPEIELVKHFYSIISVFTIILSVLGISVGKRFESVRVNDTFVEDESVAFGTWDDSEMLGGWVSPEEIRVDHIDVASFVERVCDLIDQVLAHDIIVELLRSADVEGEPSHFAANLSVLGFVPVIFGASRSEFRDEVVIIEFVRHVPQVIS